MCEISIQDNQQLIDSNVCVRGGNKYVSVDITVGKEVRVGKEAIFVHKRWLYNTPSEHYQQVGSKAYYIVSSPSSRSLSKKLIRGH